MNAKTCKTCRHFGFRGWRSFGTPICRHPDLVSVDLVSGDEYYQDPHNMRALTICCGYEGKKWEAKKQITLLINTGEKT